MDFVSHFLDRYRNKASKYIHMWLQKGVQIGQNDKINKQTPGDA